MIGSTLLLFHFLHEISAGDLLLPLALVPARRVQLPLRARALPGVSPAPSRLPFGPPLPQDDSKFITMALSLVDPDALFLALVGFVTAFMAASF